MCVCSGKNSDSCPRSSASRAMSAGAIAPWAGKIATPMSMRPSPGAGGAAARSFTCEIPEDQIRYAAGLGLALDLVLEVVDDLHPVRDIGDIRQGHVHADAGAHWEGRREAYPIQPVVEDHADIVHRENLIE